ncbi:MAG TPA: HD domain-containing protein [Planctomycetaceae bacterium]|nr:HD domain-containing protein [Planctomycetaceae bacterium]
MASPPPVTPLSRLQPGQVADCFVLLVSKERGTTRDGKPYYRVSFRDAERTVTAMIWNDSPWFSACEESWQVDQFYKLRCQYQETAYGPQIEINRIRDIKQEDYDHGFDPTRLCPGTRFDVDEMFGELVALAEEHISDAPLRRLTVGILESQQEAIKTSVAAARYHHAFRGGYLEHTLSVTRLAVHLADKYAAYYPDLEPPLSKSLVVAGAILHDIGKLQELQTRPLGGEYTASGRLIGHILLGRDLIRDAARSVPELDPETQLRLEHIIVSHQNLPEWGSPIPPRTPEALLVYFADDIDAKFNEMAMALIQARGQTDEFPSRDNPMHRRIFRGLRGKN